MFHGRKAIFEEYFAVDKELFTAGVSSYDLETLNVVAAGDFVVVEMRHRAEGLNGKRYETDHCVVFELRGGRIQTVREYVDTLYLKEQMLIRARGCPPMGFGRWGAGSRPRNLYVWISERSKYDWLFCLLVASTRSTALQGMRVT